MIRIAPSWIGEFGWETLWQAHQRYLHEGETLITTFRGMDFLYNDFATVAHHDIEERQPYWTQELYNAPKKYIKYGKPDKVSDVLIHARGLKRGEEKNYQRWQELGIEAAYIGSKEDQCYGKDLRGMPLERLVDVIAGAKVVIGGSSGTMHLAALCGTPLIVWGDEDKKFKNYWGHSLEQRYKEAWNPFNVTVKWIKTKKAWNPDTDDVIKALRGII